MLWCILAFTEYECSEREKGFSDVLGHITIRRYRDSSRGSAPEHYRITFWISTSATPCIIQFQVV